MQRLCFNCLKGVETDDELGASALGITMREDLLEWVEIFLISNTGLFLRHSGFRHTHRDCCFVQYIGHEFAERDRELPHFES